MAWKWKVTASKGKRKTINEEAGVGVVDKGLDLQTRGPEFDPQDQVNKATKQQH